MPCSRYDIKNLHHFYTRTLSLFLILTCTSYVENTLLPSHGKLHWYVSTSRVFPSFENWGHIVQRKNAFSLNVKGGPHKKIIKVQPSWIASSVSKIR